jgi:hypothetical protein
METKGSPERVTLYYREGSSDKTYQAALGDSLHASKHDKSALFLTLCGLLGLSETGSIRQVNIFRRVRPF